MGRISPEITVCPPLQRWKKKAKWSKVERRMGFLSCLSINSLTLFIKTIVPRTLDQSTSTINFIWPFSNQQANRDRLPTESTRLPKPLYFQLINQPASLSLYSNQFPLFNRKRINYQLPLRLRQTFICGFIFRRHDSHNQLMKNIPKWASANPFAKKIDTPVLNYFGGKWVEGGVKVQLPDPYSGIPNMIEVTEVNQSQADQIASECKTTPLQGLHNPLFNEHRYVQHGEVLFRVAEQLRKPEVHAFFRELVKRVMPKSDVQIDKEIIVTRRFLQNFGNDNPRFLARGFSVSGDVHGQKSHGYRFPFGNVGIITPFNFPLEIPCLQFFGSLMTGNKPLLKQDTRTALCMEQFVRMALYCGLPANDFLLVNAGPVVAEKIVRTADFKLVQFTGSSRVAEKLAQITRGKVRIEDAGCNWKIFGPDLPDKQTFEYAAWLSDQDAYAASGQKCSAQSVAFVHENWVRAKFLERLEFLAKRRNYQNRTICPVITLDNKAIEAHIKRLLTEGGGKLLFGGKRCVSKTPSVYGCFQPTAIEVSIQNFLKHHSLMTTELFAPVQVIVPYKNQHLDSIINSFASMKHHLTAGVVSNDPVFLNKVLGRSINGVTYCGVKARTTGAPQNHWFGPGGDPRAAGIGTKEAILSSWTYHRQIVQDFGPIPSGWQLPPSS